MSRNLPAIALSLLAALLFVAAGLLYQAYRTVGADRAALTEQVGALGAELSAARETIRDLEARVGALVEETTRLHEQNEGLLRSGAAYQQGS